MGRANVFDPEWHENGSPGGGFQRRRSFVGREAGSERLGASVFELEPGETASPFHAHLANEEMLVILAGRPVLKTPAGTRELETGEVVGFPVGEDGAHQVSNFSDEVVRYLIISEMRSPDVAIYPDTGLIAAYERPPGPNREGVREFHDRSAAVDLWGEEQAPEPPRD